MIQMLKKLQSSVLPSNSKKRNTTPSIIKSRLDIIEDGLRNPAWISDFRYHFFLIDSAAPEEAAFHRDYLLNILEKEMSAFYCCHTTQPPEEDSLMPLIIDLWMFKGNREFGEVSEKGNYVIAMPELPDRFRSALKDVGTHSFVQDHETLEAIFFKEMHLIVVTNHRHHTAAAIGLRKDESIIYHSRTISLEKFSTGIFVSPDFRFMDEKGNFLSKHCDPRLVACWLLTQHKIAYAHGDYSFKVSSRIFEI